MKNVNIISAAFLCSILLILTSCSKISLSDKEARELVIKTQNLPISYYVSVGMNLNQLSRLQDAGLILFSYNSGWYSSYLKVEPTDIGRPYFLGKDDSNKNPAYDSFKFKSYDIDFGAITGISINKEDQTATVRYNLLINKSPIAVALSLEPESLEKEIVFKKFDKGWQIK